MSGQESRLGGGRAGGAVLDPLRAAGPVAWSACVLDLADGRVVDELDADRVLPIASAGKLLLLVHVAARIEDGTLDPDAPVTRRPGDAVADSGVWQHLRGDTLAVEDAAVLVAAVSDNLATNVLLRLVGLEAVAATAVSTGLEHTRLLDRVRDRRHPHDADTLAVGSAAELCRLMARLAAREVVSPEVSVRVLRWLATNTDLSMVAAASGLDPLAHVRSERGLLLRNKTGSDAGVRADAGLLERAAAPGDSGTGRRGVAYAVVAGWDPAGDDHRDRAIAAMRAVGASLVDRAHGPGPGRRPVPDPGRAI